MERKKKELIQKAKVKKQYAKVKARHEREQAQEQARTGAKLASSAAAPGENAHVELEPEREGLQLHPERQAMLDGDRARDQAGDGVGVRDEQSSPTVPQGERRRRPRHPQRPDYYARDLARAQQAKAEAESRAAEAARRAEERARKVAERERLRRAMGRARRGGKDGRPKLGRESIVLLEKVKKLVGGSK